MQIGKGFSSIIAALAVVASPLATAGSWYVTGGYAVTEMDTDRPKSHEATRDLPTLNVDIEDGDQFSLGVGNEGKHLRTEFAFYQLKNDIRSRARSSGLSVLLGSDEGANSEALDVNILALSSYYSLFPESRWTPFFGAGLGYFNIEIAGEKEDKFGLLGSAGVDFRLSDDLTLSGSFKYISAGHTQFNKSRENEFSIDTDLLSYGLEIRYKIGSQ